MEFILRGLDLLISFHVYGVIVTELESIHVESPIDPSVDDVPVLIAHLFR